MTASTADAVHQGLLQRREGSRTAKQGLTEPSNVTYEAVRPHGRVGQLGRMAERAGFEPAAEHYPSARLASGYLRPLGHLSSAEPDSDVSRLWHQTQSAARQH